MKKSKIKKNQNSAIIVFILAAIIFLLFLKSLEPKLESSRKKANAAEITNKIVEQKIAPTGVIDADKLAELQNMDYEVIKKSINVENDFCTYIEDSNGNVILDKGPAQMIREGICR